MSLQIRVKRDEITPDLNKKITALKDATPILRAAGTQLVSLTKRAFRDPSLRAAAWAPKSDGSARTLIKKGVMISSIRITALDARSVSVGSDRVQAAIQQLGGVIRAKGKPLVFTIGGKKVFAQKATIPASPFFPFSKDGALAPFAVRPVGEAIRLATDKALGIR